MTREHVMHRLAATMEAGAGAGVRSGTTARRRGDHDLSPGLEPEGKLTRAAVLVPLIDRPEGMTVLLTQRTETLNNHAGQVSFPGGRVEDGDEDAVAAALRETEEEIGVPGARIEIAGRLDDYVTRTGYFITPVVGLLTPPLELTPDPREVADIFEVPLAFVLDPANHQRESRVFAGAERFFYVLPFPDRYIWGATAGMLVNLYDVLSD